MPVVPSITAPVGAPIKLHVKVSGGMSESVALALNVSNTFSFVSFIGPPISVIVGFVFTPPTITVIVSEVARGGTPSSVTTTSNVASP